MKITTYVLATLFGMSTFMFACKSDKKDDVKKEDAKTETTEAPAEEAPEMKAFSSDAGNFTINFPGEPTQSSEKIATDVGEVEINMFMYEASVTKAYLVGFSDYPSEAIKASDAKTMLKNAQGGVIGNFNATADKENWGKFGEYESLDFVAVGGSYHIAYKLILVKNRLYQIGILQDGSDVPAADIEAFIGSFKLKE